MNAQFSTEDDILDLDNFEKLEKNDIDLDKWKFYIIMNKSNGNKNIAKNSISYLENFTKKDKISLCREVDISSRFVHPSILKSFGYSLTDFKKRSRPVILFEFFSNNSLDSYLFKNKNDNQSYLSDTQKLITIYGIAAGMSYLHSHNIIHCDLTPKNIFFDEFFQPKISGFSFSIEITQDMDKNQPIKESVLKGTLEYAAPEVLSNLEYSKSVDVYSFAILIFQILTDETFSIDEIDRESIFKNISEKIDSIKDEYRNLIKKCLSENPRSRPTFDEIINELRTNSNFITDKIDTEKYQNYMNYIENSTKLFDINKRKRQLYDILKYHKVHDYEKLTSYLKGPDFLGNNYQLPRNAYKNILISKNEYDICEINLIDKNKQKYYMNKGANVAFENKKNFIKKYEVQCYQKEINNFARHEITNFHRKINIISQLNHPIIQKFVGYSQLDFDSKNKPVIIFENSLSIPFSSLIEQMRTEKDNESSMNMTNQLIIIYLIASAMSYLHIHNIIHRDLKPDNIYFYNQSADDFLIPKLSGFDIAMNIKNESFVKSEKIKGTPAYLAPEIYLRKEYSKKSDVYSFGLVIYELLTKKKIFDDKNSPQEIRRIIVDNDEKPNIDVPMNETYRQLIERCLSREPKSRPTFEEIVKELKTNPGFITEEIDGEEYIEFIKFIDQFPTSFDTEKRITLFDDINEFKINTFDEAAPYFSLKNMYDTETNDLLFNNSYFNLFGYKECEFKKGLSYDIDKITNNKNEVFICKKFKSDNYFISKSEFINFSRELNIVPCLNHPAILKFIGYNRYYQQNPAIIVEYLPNGSLLEYITKSNEVVNPINETQKLIIIYGIACAFSYLHSNNILHRDLKPANIFLDDMLYPKISGFNIAKNIKNNSFIKSEKIKGTPAYLAPEIYLRKEYSKKSDVYSFGLVIYELLTKKKIFDDKNSPQEIRRIVVDNGEKPNIDVPMNETYRQLIERCLSREPKSRPTFEEIVKELKTNPGFITEEIDEKEFNKYIEFIEKSPITYNSKNAITQFDYVKKLPITDFNELETKINYRNVYETELNNVLFDYDYINLNDFEKQKLVYSEYAESEYKIYNIINKKTKRMYCAKMFKEKYVDNIFKDYFSNEVNFLSLNHPAIINIIGYSPVDHKNRPYPVIISEYAANNSLKNILSNDIQNNQKLLLNDTKRLIIIYGIASGMAYLHSHNLIHSKLKPSKIFLDDFLFPKISGYNSCKDLSANPIPDINQLISLKNIFNCEFYTSPERSNYYKDSYAGDVYSFGIITYVLISNQEPFADYSKEIKRQALTGKLRPTFNESVPYCYRKLIEKCWAHEPKERPTFDEIIYHLKTNPEFINENIDKEEYLNYINFIEKAQSKTNCLQVDDFIKTANKTFRKVYIDFKKIQDPFKQNFLINMGSLNLQMFERQKKIGEGGFGVVYQLLEKDEGSLYAGKISKLEIDQSINDTIIDLSREINIISQLNHQTILGYKGFSPTNFKNKQKPVIVTEYASNGSLDKIIELERQGLGIHEWDDTKKLINIYGIALGLSYLHHQNIIHRDLKPANILLDDYLYPKIADFGLSKKLTEQDNYEKYGKTPKTSGFKGTYSYCAPEVIDSNIYTKSGDIYSFGMIVYEIMTNEIPFKNINIYQLMLKLIDGYRPIIKYPIPYCYRKLIEKCWCQDPNSRPKIDDIVKKLETDKKFITQNVDEEEFHNYIYNIKGNVNECIQKNTNNPIIANFTNKVSLTTNHSDKVEENDIIETDENIFIDLTKYERKDIISKGDLSKIYKFQEIDTGLLFSGQMSMLEIKKMSKEDFNDLSHELKIIKELNHPSLLKFIGYSDLNFKKSRKPVIVTEYACNGTLEDILHHERINKSIDGWNETKKLINIFGIASAMSYLHSRNIIHRSLKTSTIYLDEILTPKIGDFGLSTRFPSSDCITVQTISCVKAIPIYSAPEVLQSNEYSKSSDVYAFSLIVFEILTNEIPFHNITNNNQIFNEVVINHKRPEIKKSISNSYRHLIEKCWSQNANDRPTFDQIVTDLKTDPGFITSNINKDDYFRYIAMVEKQIKPKKIEEKDDFLNTYCHNSHEINKINIEQLELLAKKYSLENDTENTYKFFNILIKIGNCTIPLEYAVRLYKLEQYEQAFKYFTLISGINHPIAKYFVGIMKYYGRGCKRNLEDSYKILKHLSDNGIDRASEFIEENEF